MINKAELSGCYASISMRFMPFGYKFLFGNIRFFNIKILIFTLTVIFFISNVYSLLDNQIPDSIDKINISLNSESEINKALFDIKHNNEEDFKLLKELRNTDKEKFNKKLYKVYYTLIHTKVLEKKMKKKKLGYRQKVRQFDLKLKKLQTKYNQTSKNEQNKVKDEILNLSIQRYEIELELLKFHELNTKEFLEELKNKIQRFIKNKDKYVNRIVNKTVSK